MKPHWKYLRYVIRHKWFVFVAGLSLRVPIWQLIVHDWSKFLPSEWFPYANYFYGSPKVGDRVEFDCIDGFSGVATIIEKRPVKNAQYKIRVDNGYIGESQEFWAHDFEIEKVATLQAAFDSAWNHHQKCQPHHWQYWLLTMDSGESVPIAMPERYIREMVADWIGAGQAITGDGSLARTAAWYEANKDKMKLHASTRQRVEALLSPATARQLELV